MIYITSSQVNQSSTDLLKEYNRLKTIVGKLQKEVGHLTKEQKNILLRFESIEGALKRAGILTGTHELKTSEWIFMYFWVPRSEYAIIKKEGLKPSPIPMMNRERTLFYKILKEKGINFPEEVVIGRLSPEPYQPAEIALTEVLLKAPVPVRHIYVGDWDAYMMLVESGDTKERMEYVKFLANSIMKLITVKSLATVDLSKYIAFFDRAIPPRALMVSGEHMKYIKFGEKEFKLPAWALTPEEFAAELKRPVNSVVNMHRWIVRQAILDGYDIPGRVLKYYPDLLRLYIRRRGR